MYSDAAMCTLTLVLRQASQLASQPLHTALKKYSAMVGG
jgi:hypothetical protein